MANKRSSTISVAILMVWFFGSLSTLGLFLEFPPKVADIHWRTYPGQFFWPVVFLPISCVFLVRPIGLIIGFIASKFSRPTIGLTIFFLPIIVIVVGMSGFEWFNGKHAIWELSPDVSQRHFSIRVNNVGNPTGVYRSSFDDYALSIRSKGLEQDNIPECRFSGKDRPAYLMGRCFCAPAHKVTNGHYCDALRHDLYANLGRAIMNADNRSVTYYLYRFSFSVMATIFVTGLMTVGFLTTFSRHIAAFKPGKAKVASAHVRAFAMLCVIWWAQRLYFGYEQFKIFPADDDAVFFSYIMSICIGAIIILGTIYAFGHKVEVIKAFMDNLFFPILAIASFALGTAEPELIARIFRVTFGVDATLPTIIGFVTLSLGLCLIPTLDFILDSDRSLLKDIEEHS